MSCKVLLAPSTDVAMRCWTVIVSYVRGGCTGGTYVGSQGDTLRLSIFDFGYADYVLGLPLSQRPSDFIFRVTGVKFRRHFNAATASVGLASLDLSPHLLRHGVTSRDAILARHDSQAIKKWVR